MSAVLTRPNVIARAVTLAAIALAVVALISFTGGSPTYDLKLLMTNASGLRPGSQVLLGGVPVGTVNNIYLGRRDVVVVDLALNPGQVHIGKGVTAHIIAANLLGEEYVSLDPGQRDEPLASGTTLPLTSTTAPTDLDQIVDVLDGGTRARLEILLNEAGIAVAGRQSDVSAILRQLPLSLTAATNLLTQMVQDNHTLGDLVTNSNQFIARVDAQSGDLKQVIGSAAGAADTLAARAADLRQAVIDAPQSLQTLQGFFHGVDATAAELTPATREIAKTAPSLVDLLGAVKPFTVAAVPTLNRAAAVAPILTTLAVKATPTVKLGVPTLSAIENIAVLAKPLSAWLGLGANDLFNIFSGWPGAIQFRDGISHIFNGDVALNPKIILNTADQGASAAQRRQNLLDVRSSGLLRAMGLLGAALLARQQPATPSSAPKHHGLPTTSVGKPSLGGVTLPPVGNGGGASGGGATGGGLAGTVNKVLGLLTPKSGSGAAPPTATTTTTTPTTTPATLQHLLTYLIGK